jgi:2-C-methyl-D-erythritol 4-phosphate cytidylyltransferase
VSAEFAALLAAAGSGTRLGRGPKALLEVGGRTLLDIALEALAPFVDEVVVAVPPGALAAWPRRAGVRYVEGGSTRQESVRHLVAAASARYVLVHDVARPFLPADVVTRVMAAVREHGAATAALAVADTVVTEAGDELDRSQLRAVQTPQGFERELLLVAHEEAAAAGAAATDDAALVRRLGRRVALVEGSPLLMKVTRPEDLVVAEALARRLAAAAGGGR